MAHLHFQKDDFVIDTHPAKLNIQYIHEYLATKSYWAQNIPLQTVKKSIKGACCFGVYHNGTQVGFARVISDYATFAYLCDVFIDEAYRGRGLSKWLMEVIDAHPKLQNLRNWALGTKDAHGLYAQFGYTAYPDPSRMMRRYNADVYNPIP